MTSANKTKINLSRKLRLGGPRWQDATGERTRLVAVRRHHGISPHTVVTADPAELRAVLVSHQHTPTRP